MSDKQFEFEESMISLDELLEQENMESCDEDEMFEDYHIPCYNEIMFDEEGNPVKNFLGHVKE